MPYIDKTGKEVALAGTLGEQNLAANKAGLDFVPAKTTPTVGGVTPTTSTVPDKTIADSGITRYGANNPYIAPTAGTYDAEAAKLAALANAPVKDEATIREEMRQRVQEQIDAIKNTTAGLIAKENIAGEGRLGETRAASARSGTLGQDFGIAEKAKVENLNAAQVKALENERDVTISGILGKIDSAAYDRAQNAKVEASTNTENYMTYLKESRDQARTDALNLAKSGGSLDKLTDDQYKKLLDKTEYSPEQLQALFTTNKPQDKVLTSFTQGSQYIVVTQDPITGQRKTEKIDLGFEAPIDWKDTKLDDGSILFYNPKNPSEQKIYHPATTGKGTSGAIFSPEDKRVISQAGLANADERTRAIFVNTPTAFRQSFIQSGKASDKMTPNELLDALTKWEQEQGGGNPFE